MFRAPPKAPAPTETAEAPGALAAQLRAKLDDAQDILGRFEVESVCATNLPHKR